MTQSGKRTTSSLSAAIHQALDGWNNSGDCASALQELALFRYYQRLESSAPQQAVQRLLGDALARLATKHEREAWLLRRRFIEGQLAFRIAHEANWAESTFYRKQQAALALLTETVSVMEAELQREWRRRNEARLELPTYVHLIGVEEHLDVLTDLLTQAGPPWLVTLTGMGGIGKTALADALVRRLLNGSHSFEFGWVTARQSVFNLGGSIQPAETPALSVHELVQTLVRQLTDDSEPAPLGSHEAMHWLTRRLKAEAHLIFIDNLETLVDVEALLPALRRLTGPSRFVLTSRHSLFSEPDIHHFTVPELSQLHALDLLRNEAQLRNLARVAAASDGELQPIFDAVGGNPLALRLVVGQLHVHGLDTVLDDLTTAYSPTADSLYTFIYRRAWEYLNERERSVLLAMPMLSDDGGAISYLAAITQLDEGELHPVLNRLVTLNLVESRGGLHERRYAIHNLTRTFLHRQVAKWS
jgi:hypothetical protein